MKTVIFLLVFIILLLPGNGYTDCKKGCTTTIIVKDCDDDGVKNADVTIRVCCGKNEEITEKTDTFGKAQFNYYYQDICETKVICHLKVSSTATIKSCKCKNQKDAECVIRICSDVN